MPAVEPCQNSFLLGHREAEQLFLQAWKSGTLHNSWLIGGPEGIGKATFAYRAARFLLSADESRKESYQSLEVPENDVTFRLVAQKSHPDMKVLERDFIETDKKKIIKAIKDGEPLKDSQLQELKKSSVIKIDEVRTIHEFLSKKSFDGRWRIVLIDSVDDLNTASANALLKILEEPPVKSLIFLVSHNPYRLLPTIRSRCAKLNLQPLEATETASLLRRYASELSEADIKGLAGICGGRIGRALLYAQNNALQQYRRLEKLCYARERDFGDLTALCTEAAQNEDLWNLTIELMARFVSENLKGGQNIKELGEAWDIVTKMLREQVSLNMDKTQTLFIALSKIGKAMTC